jgi:hypothetical protein
VPPLQIRLQADLGKVATLRGANLEPVSAVSATLQPPATLTVTLAWQAQTEIDTSYRVFLHLLRPDGSLMVQSDSEPANWTRPTTGWAAGEVVLDERILEIPSDATTGRYRLVTGFYHPGTRERLALPDGATAVLITTLEVGQK